MTTKTVSLVSPHDVSNARAIAGDHLERADKQARHINHVEASNFDALGTLPLGDTPVLRSTA